MSLYGQYIKERENFEIFEIYCGFGTYQIQGNQVYLRDLFVEKEMRNQKMATVIADEICSYAKGAGCTEMIGSIATTDPNATDTIKVLLAYGMKLRKVTEELLLFSKEI